MKKRILLIVTIVIISIISTFIITGCTERCPTCNGEGKWGWNSVCWVCDGKGRIKK